MLATYFLTTHSFFLLTLALLSNWRYLHMFGSQKLKHAISTLTTLPRRRDTSISDAIVFYYLSRKTVYILERLVQFSITKQGILTPFIVSSQKEHQPNGYFQGTSDISYYSIKIGSCQNSFQFKQF